MGACPPSVFLPALHEIGCPSLRDFRRLGIRADVRGRFCSSHLSRVPEAKSRSGQRCLTARLKSYRSRSCRFQFCESSVSGPAFGAVRRNFIKPAPVAFPARFLKKSAGVSTTPTFCATAEAIHWFKETPSSFARCIPRAKNPQAPKNTILLSYHKYSALCNRNGPYIIRAIGTRLTEVFENLGLALPVFDCRHLS